MTEINTDIFLRSIDGSTAKVILAFLFNRGGMTLEELQIRTGLDPKTLSKSVKLLSSSVYQMLSSQRGDHGRITWLPVRSLLPGLSSVWFGISDRENFPICEDGRVEQLGSGRENLPTWSEKTGSESENLPTWAGSDLIDDDPFSKNHHQRFEPGPALPDPENLLSAIGALRGKLNDSEYQWEPLSIGDLPKGITSIEILAWIVKVYKDRERLRTPEGLLRIRLIQRAKRNLYPGWDKRLPVEFLSFIGFASIEGEPLGDDPDEPAETENERFPDPELDKLWSPIREQFRMEMPRDTFALRVEPLIPAAYEDGSLTLIAPDKYTRDWVDSRLSTSIQRLMVGICNHSDPRIEIITPEES
jgi:hypothetical protein